MKTIIHYSNGESYGYLGYTIDGWVDWDEEVLRLVDDTETISKPKSVYLTPDTLYIEVRDPACGYYSVWTNPKYEMSVVMDVMTAKSRSKANRSNLLSIIGQTTKSLKGVWSVKRKYR